MTAFELLILAVWGLCVNRLTQSALEWAFGEPRGDDEKA